MSIQLSKENMLKGMNDMNAFGSRLTGSKGHHEFVEYLKEEVRAIGYEPVSDVKTFERWEEKETKLVLHTKKGDVDIPVASAFPYSGETCPEGFTGKLSKLRPFKDIVVMRMPDFSRIPSAVAFSERRAMPADLHLTRFYKGPVAVAFVKATIGIFLAKFTGAKSAVFIWQKMSNEMVQGQYLNFILGHLGIPTLWVNEEAGKELLKARKKKTKATLTLDAEIEKKATAESFYVVVPGKNHKENVIINTHTSAYGTDGDLQTRQMQMMFDDMAAEYKKGNYVICGGDFNHDFTGDSKYKLNDATPEDLEALAWCAEFPAELIPEGFARVTDYASGLRPSTRNTDIPYSDASFVVTLDGFIVSDNIEPTFVDVIDTGFKYSDHNPVKMKFKLK